MGYPYNTHFFTEKPLFKWLCSLHLWFKDQQLKQDKTSAQHSEETWSLILSFFHKSNTLCKEVGVNIKDTNLDSWDNEIALVL